MKQFASCFKVALFITTFFISFLSFAKKAAYYNVTNTSEKSNLILYDIPQGSIVSIINAKGVTLYKKYNSNSNTYNLSFLPNGSYYFEIDKNLVIERIPFIVASKMLYLDKEDKKAPTGTKKLEPFCFFKNNEKRKDKIILYCEKRKHYK